MGVKLKGPDGSAVPMVKEEKAPKGEDIEVPDQAKLDYVIDVIKKTKKSDQIVVKADTIPDVERVPTGVFEFDLATGGGFPRGRISIGYGTESSGKTNLALKAIASVQKTFPKSCNRCAFVNLESTFDPVWAARMGVDVAELDVVNPAYGEEAVDVVDALLRAQDLAFMAVDSIAVLVSNREIAKSVETADVGTSAMLVKRMCNKAVIALAMEARKKHYPVLLLINQRRFKPGVLFGDPETMPGGEAMKFMSSLTYRMYGKNVKDPKVHPDLPVYKHTSVIIKKSKVPVTAVEFEYDMCMVDGSDLDVGDTDSWNVVSGHLKSIGKLAKVPTGWSIYLEVYKNLVNVQERYLCDPAFRVRCQQDVIKSVADKKFLVPEKEEQAPKQGEQL